MVDYNENNIDFQQIIDKLGLIETMLKKLTDKKDSLKSEELLDNSDICILLGITKRTLQRYRQKGILPYYMMGGKPYYKAAEVQESLKRIMRDRNDKNNNIKFK
jgi:hypothetical protein